ncbi:MAG TPA: hypothetical protein VFP39_02035 [Gemmatimonadales bacterium]|nr:hypothetical protein [Gemmatimonadales bacterium]
MPRVSIWLIRAALLHLWAGFTLGALLLANKGAGFAPGMWRWLPVHFELLLVGWFVQLVMGVAYWIFPRFGMTRAARGREQLAWAAWGFLNAGIGLVCLGEMSAQAALVLVGRLAEVAAAASMAGNIWARTRASGITAM